MYTLKQFLEFSIADQTKNKIDGRWVPARPEPYHSWWFQLKDAWEVFRGRADAVKWPGGQ